MSTNLETLYRIVLEEHDHLIAIYTLLHDKQKIVESFCAAFNRHRKDKELMMWSCSYPDSERFEHKIEHREILNAIFFLDMANMSIEDLKSLLDRTIKGHIDIFDNKLLRFVEELHNTLRHS